MTNDHIEAAQPQFLESFLLSDVGRRATMISFALSRAGWIVLPIAFVFFLLSGNLTVISSEGDIVAWNILFLLLVFWCCQFIFEVIHRRWQALYREPLFRMLRIQIPHIFGKLAHLPNWRCDKLFLVLLSVGPDLRSLLLRGLEHCNREYRSYRGIYFHMFSRTLMEYCRQQQSRSARGQSNRLVCSHIRFSLSSGRYYKV